MIKNRVLAAVAGLSLFLGGVAIAQRPRENVSPGRHPNLAAAQSFSAQAFDKVTAAQEANEWDMEGHAKRAKELLQDVNKELKIAAGAANRNAR
jgi:hypothetical protein